MNNIETLKKERLDEMLSEFLRDFKEDKLTAEGWPTHLSVYTTDINGNNGVCPVEDGASGPVMLALLPDDGPSGLFFAGTEASGF
ncbi:hypothetical protein NL676_011989 [Syzygium grande]|nr:hypothetical protein NL676_011989 [Syzygium grande]